MLLARFHAAVAEWFQTALGSPTEPQRLGWPAIQAGRDTLIAAPTGSGKTLAAFLWVLDRLHHEPVPPASERCRVLYVSPLKALVYDVDRNLAAPLAGIRHAAARLDSSVLPEITTFLRTGDTLADQRRTMLRHPPDILITTPESLFLILTSQARRTLAPVRWVIVDEVHAVAGTKRGAHLAVSLERLEEITTVPPQRIGLSATQRPLDAVARFLGGGTVQGEVWEPRPVTIVDTPLPRPLDLEIVVPVADMAAPAPPDPLDEPAGDASLRTISIWPAVYPQILDLIRSHKSTIVFANSRRLAERICAEVNALAGEEISRAHHGSVAREQRVQIEEALKRGDLKAVVATSSLELGIDMGAVDLVVQVEAPTSVASGLQRVGRSGHHVGGESRARIFPKFRGDLLAATVIAHQMSEGDIEPTVILRNPLDVLSQQLVACAALESTTADRLFALCRRAAPYSQLGRDLFDATLDMLAGRYPSDLFAELRPRLNWDRVSGEVSARPGARQLVIANAGTIPDRGLYRVTLPDGARVGELDEEMVYESRVGDVFILGASTWRIVEIGHDKVEVVPAPGEPAARMPFWKGDSLGRPYATGSRIGRFIREIRAMEPEEAREVLRSQYRLDQLATQNLLAYLEDQASTGAPLPTDQTLVVERFRDEIGDWRVAILSPFGARVHAPWAMALTHKLRGRYGSDVDVIWADDGISFRFPVTDEVPGAADLALDPEELRPLLEEHLADTALFAARFREAAGRALLLPRRRPGSRTPLWLQRRKAADLLKVARQFATFPIVLEAYREILSDDFDLPALEHLLTGIRSRRIRLVEVDAATPSPFASSLLFAFVAAFLYEADTPLAERRAAALSVDRDLLRSLLGEGELTELISPETLAALELELQYLTADRKARNLDAVADLLRLLGPLSTDDLEVRSEDVDVAAVLEQLNTSHRVIQVRIGGRELWAAIEDAGRLRDAIGVQPPPGVPVVFLEPAPDPLGEVVARYARTHGPFTTREAATALTLPIGVVDSVLRQLEQASRVGRGTFRSGAEPAWVDLDVLRRLKRRSLAELRSQIEAVDAQSLARFLPHWHGVAGDPKRGRSALIETVRRLQGVELAASVLTRDVLPLRVHDPDPLLDQLMLEGDLVWAGRGPLGGREGRVALYFRDQLPLLWQPIGEEAPQGPVHDALRRHLEERGASFFRDLYSAAGGGDPGAVLDGLWDLVWAGEVTNDTLAPVRALLAARNRRASARPNLSGGMPPESAGRWSLLPTEQGSPTARATAWTEVLLDRHGIVTRPAVAAEVVVGGFAGLYPVLTRMEEIGRIRRGYFVEGLGGAQFALAGAVDRLRSGVDTGVVALASTDPANPYGAALPWPEVAELALARSAGSYVFLVDGALGAYLERGGKRLAVLTPDPDLFSELARELATIAGRHRRFTLERIGAEPAAGSGMAPALSEWGFVAALRGLTFRR
ncbi:MAG: DEAD/DEAH box helicase [Acidimicrobiia bacterium]|nr:DEAD/DEAH box helicase [Acidimicrobiia bacterium]